MLPKRPRFRPRHIVPCTLLLLAFLILPSCARRYVEIHRGLTPQQVIERLGSPNLTSIDPGGNTVWIYTDRDLRDLPMVEKGTKGDTIRLRLQEESPRFRSSTQGPYRMILKLVFNDTGRVERFEYGTLQRRGPLLGP